MRFQLFALLLIALIMAGTLYISSSSPRASIQTVTVTSIKVVSGPTTSSSTKNFTVMQGTGTYIILESNLLCFTWDNCTVSVSEPFSLLKAPAEELPMPTEYYIYSLHSVSYLNPGLRPFYGGNMLLWIKAPNSNYTGVLTITMK